MTPGTACFTGPPCSLVCACAKGASKHETKTALKNALDMYIENYSLIVPTAFGIEKPGPLVKGPGVFLFLGGREKGLQTTLQRCEEVCAGWQHAACVCDHAPPHDTVRHQSSSAALLHEATFLFRQQAGHQEDSYVSPAKGYALQACAPYRSVHPQCMFLQAGVSPTKPPSLREGGFAISTSLLVNRREWCLHQTLQTGRWDSYQKTLAQ